MMRYLYTISICFAFAVAVFGIFGVAKAEACQIVSSGTGFRIGGADTYTDNSYDDTNANFIYFDIQTENCNTAPSTRLDLKLFDVDLDDQTEIPISTITIEVGQEGSLLAVDTNYKTSQSEFTIPMHIGEAGIDGSCNYDVMPNFGNFFAELAVWYYTGIDAPDCTIFAKIINVNTGQELFSDGSASEPRLIYECHGLCNVQWVNYCGSDYVMGSEPLPYGPPNVCENNVPTEDVTLNGVPDEEGSTLDYSEEPLAPLPGFSSSPDLGGFLQSFFTILIVIAGLLALIMIIVGGITYMTSEGFGQKSNAKDYIVNALTGLVLALGAWVILNTINPDLAADLDINIPVVGLTIGDAPLFPDQPTSFGNGTVTSSTLPTDLGLVCSGSGGSAAVPAIIDSFNNKVTYRWGGKGGPLPAGASFPSSPGEADGPHMCTDDSGANVPCRTFCPANSVCLDCSGFVNQVRKCAGLTFYSTGTGGMTQHTDATSIDMSQLIDNGQGVTIEGSQYMFMPGDMLVWDGHVVMYYGGGQIAESEGSEAGLQTNYNIKISPITKYKDKITHLIKVNP